MVLVAMGDGGCVRCGCDIDKGHTGASDDSPQKPRREASLFLRSYEYFPGRGGAGDSSSRSEQNGFLQHAACEKPQYQRKRSFRAGGREVGWWWMERESELQLFLPKSEIEICESALSLFGKLCILTGPSAQSFRFFLHGLVTGADGSPFCPFNGYFYLNLPEFG